MKVHVICENWKQDVEEYLMACSLDSGVPCSCGWSTGKKGRDTGSVGCSAAR